MLDIVLNLFSGSTSHRKAVLGLARIISRYDLVNLSYSEGLRENRRARDEHHATWGVWMFECKDSAKARDFDAYQCIPAVTHDLRGEGLGIMTPIRLKGAWYIVAVPDEDDDNWKFFKCQVRHNTRRPGGWFQIGLQVESLIDLEMGQRAEFREHIQNIESQSVE